MAPFVRASASMKEERRDERERENEEARQVRNADAKWVQTRRRAVARGRTQVRVQQGTPRQA